MNILIFKNKWTNQILVYPKVLHNGEISAVVNLYTKEGNWELQTEKIL